MNAQTITKNLTDLLEGGQAHTKFAEALKPLPFDLQGKRPTGCPHSPWELLEHLRIAQSDILEFTRNAAHVSPNFPEGYWPTSQTPPNAQAWQDTAEAFEADLQSLIALVSADGVDVSAEIPHAAGYSLLREILVAADHNSYHLGQLVLVRRLLGHWE